MYKSRYSSCWDKAWNMDALPKLVQTPKGSFWTESSRENMWVKKALSWLAFNSVWPVPTYFTLDLIGSKNLPVLVQKDFALLLLLVFWVLFACSQDNKPILWKSSMKDFLIAVSSREETQERKIEPAFTMWQDHWPQGYLKLGCWNFSGGGVSQIFGWNFHPDPDRGFMPPIWRFAYLFKWVGDFFGIVEPLSQWN